LYENRHQLHLTTQHNTASTILLGYMKHIKYKLLKLKIVRNETSQPFKKSKAPKICNTTLYILLKIIAL
jgi:hypothetical protein